MDGTRREPCAAEPCRLCGRIPGPHPPPTDAARAHSLPLPYHGRTRCWSRRIRPTDEVDEARPDPAAGHSGRSGHRMDRAGRHPLRHHPRARGSDVTPARPDGGSGGHDRGGAAPDGRPRQAGAAKRAAGRRVAAGGGSLRRCRARRMHPSGARSGRKHLHGEAGSSSRAPAAAVRGGGDQSGEHWPGILHRDRGPRIRSSQGRRSTSMSKTRRTPTFWSGTAGRRPTGRELHGRDPPSNRT